MHGTQARCAFTSGVHFDPAQCPFSALIWYKRSILGHALQAVLPDVPIQRISIQSFSHLVQVVASSENDRTWSYSSSKTPIFDSSTTKQKSKPFTGLAIKLEVQKYCLTCLSIVLKAYMYLYGPSLVAKMTLFTLICWRNKRETATFVPLPCLWFDSHDKRWLFLPFCWRNTWKNVSRMVVFDRL